MLKPSSIPKPLTLAVVLGGLLLASPPSAQAYNPCTVGSQHVPCTVMAIGDESAYGYGDDYSGGWRSRLDQELISNGFIKANWKGATTGPWNKHNSYPGWTTATIASQVSAWIAADKPNVAILEAGMNDLIFGGQTPTQVIASVSALADQIYTNPNFYVRGSELIVATLIPQGYASGPYDCTATRPASGLDATIDLEIRQVNAGIAAYVQQRSQVMGWHVTLLDMYAAISADPGYPDCTNHGWLTLSPYGYLLGARALIAQLSQYMPVSDVAVPTVVNHPPNPPAWIPQPPQYDGNGYDLGLPVTMLKEGDSTLYGCCDQTVGGWRPLFDMLAVGSGRMPVIGVGKGVGPYESHDGIPGGRVRCTTGVPGSPQCPYDVSLNIISDVQTFHPKIVYLQAGINDLDFDGRSAADVSNDMFGVMENAIAYSQNEALVVVALIPPPGPLGNWWCPPTPTSCSTVADCQTGQQCVNNQCLSCQADADCGSNQICRSGTCGPAMVFDATMVQKVIDYNAANLGSVQYWANAGAHIIAVDHHTPFLSDPRWPTCLYDSNLHPSQVAGYPSMAQTNWQQLKDYLPQSQLPVPWVN